MTATHEMVRSTAVAVLVLTAASACVGPGPEGSFDDATLFATVAALDGVASSDLSYQNDFGNSNIYSGHVELEPDADAGCVLVQTLGVLAQGHAGADLAYVTVQQGDRSLSLQDIPGDVWRSLRSAAERVDATTPEVPECTGTAAGVPSGDASMTS